MSCTGAQEKTMSNWSSCRAGKVVQAVSSTCRIHPIFSNDRVDNYRNDWSPRSYMYNYQYTRQQTPMESRVRMINTMRWNNSSAHAASNKESTPLNQRTINGVVAAIRPASQLTFSWDDSDRSHRAVTIKKAFKVNRFRNASRKSGKYHKIVFQTLKCVTYMKGREGRKAVPCLQS